MIKLTKSGLHSTLRRVLSANVMFRDPKDAISWRAVLREDVVNPSAMFAPSHGSLITRTTSIATLEKNKSVWMRKKRCGWSV